MFIYLVFRYLHLAHFIFIFVTVAWLKSYSLKISYNILYTLVSFLIYEIIQRNIQIIKDEIILLVMPLHPSLVYGWYILRILMEKLLLGFSFMVVLESVQVYGLWAAKLYKQWVKILQKSLLQGKLNKSVNILLYIVNNKMHIWWILILYIYILL